MANKNGFALIVVIWVISLLSIMAASFSETTRRELNITQALKSNASAITIAETWFNLAQVMIKHQDPYKRWQGNGKIYQIEQENAQIRVKIVAESGKVDINFAKDTLLKAVISFAVSDHKQQLQLFDAILDWRDPDNKRRKQGAEANDYQDLNLNYQPSNRPFESIDELQLVAGMTPEVFKLIEPLFTVYSQQADVNIRLASKKLLQIMASQLAENNTHDLSIEQILNENNDIDADIAAIPLDQMYTIIVETHLQDNSAASVQGVIKFDANIQGNTVSVLDWKTSQDATSLFNLNSDTEIITVKNEFTINY